jgi:AcrR family transcriptional regulator
VADCLAVTFSLPELAHGLPEPPPSSLDPYLDAAARCFARYGVGRTTVQDVAREARVNRTTVYRQVGGTEQLLRLLLARDLHRLLATMPEAVARDRPGPQLLVRVLCTLITEVRDHPVVAKVLADEPEVIGPLLTDDLPDVLARIAPAVVPLLAAAMDDGVLARRDPAVVADWLVRIAVTVLLSPPPGELELFLGELLLPALTPPLKSRKERR